MTIGLSCIGLSTIWPKVKSRHNGTHNEGFERGLNQRGFGLNPPLQTLDIKSYALINAWSACAMHSTPKPRAFTRQPESPNVQISGSRRFKHNQNSTKRHPREGRNNDKLWWERETKERNFGWVPRREWSLPFLPLPPTPFSSFPFSPPFLPLPLSKPQTSLKFGACPSSSPPPPQLEKTKKLTNMLEKRD